MSIADNNQVSKPRRSRRRNGRRLLWLVFSVGLLAILSVGIYRARFITLPSLMDDATWIAPFDKYSTYRWNSDQEMTLYSYRVAGLAVFRWNIATRQVTLLQVKKHVSFTNFEESPSVMQGRRINQIMVVKAWIVNPGLGKNLKMPPPDHVWKLANTEDAAINHGSCVTSPDGKYVAYTARMQRPDPLGKLLRRFKFIHLPEPKTGVGIMVNDAEGKNARLLGFTEVEMPEKHTKYSNSGTTASLQNLQWRPDGKKLSFEYGDGIYAIPTKQ